MNSRGRVEWSDAEPNDGNDVRRDLRAEREQNERNLSVLQRELREQVNESERLRDLARAMAESPDTAALLRMLADSANELCMADATAVTRVEQGVVYVLAFAAREAIGVDPRGQSYRVDGTITELVVRDGRPFSTANLPDVLKTFPGTADVRPWYDQGNVGPAMMVPLLAQGELVGVVMSTRVAGAEPFSLREERRLRVIADHGAVVLRKSQLFEEVEAANRAKSLFLATISHELRTPLTALTGYSELLADEILGPLSSAQMDTVERMRVVTYHLTVMIDAMLSFSSLEGGRERVVLSQVTADSILRDVASVVEPLARHHGLEFESRLTSAIGPFETDAEKVRQIVMNLCDNAIKFTPRGGRVTLEISDGGGEIRFTVADTGIGIAADDSARLFQPFMQIDSGLTRRFGGAGLGLHISHRLATLLGGRIDVTSEPGTGSTFSLVIPRRLTH